MQKWLDDLHTILIKRGFITLDNVLKNYYTDKTTLNNLNYTVTSGDIPINTDSEMTGSCKINLTRAGKLVELMFTGGGFTNGAYGYYTNVFTIPIEYRPHNTKKFVVTSRTGGKPVGINININGQVDIQIMSAFTGNWDLINSCNTLMYFI